MKRNVLFLLVVATTLLAWNRNFASEGALVARLASFRVKPGARAQMEDAIKKQMDWRRDQKDEWRWLTWECVSGEAGRYTVATFGHAWQDFDQPKVSPLVEEVNQGALSAVAATAPVIQYFDHLEEVSAMGAATESPTLAELTIFQVQFGKTAQFYAALREFHAAMQKAGSPARYEWFELLSGGESPQFMLFLPRRDWAAFDARGGALPGALEKSVGEKKARQVFDRFTASVKISQRSAIRLRPDLSCLGPSTATKLP
jgi:hypothetical protein